METDSHVPPSPDVPGALPNGNAACERETGTDLGGLIGLLSEARLQIENFFELSIDLLCIVDGMGRFTRVSRAWEDLLGYPAAELVGAEFVRFVHPDDIGRTEIEFAKVCGGEATMDFVNRFRTADGSYRFIEWRSKQVNGITFGSARDITDRKETEMALARALEDEKRAAALTRSLVSVASHEFRTPIASIRLATELLKSQAVAPGGAEADQLLDMILKTTDYLAEVVGSVLDPNSDRHSPTAIPNPPAPDN